MNTKLIKSSMVFVAALSTTLAVGVLPAAAKKAPSPLPNALNIKCDTTQTQSATNVCGAAGSDSSATPIYYGGSSWDAPFVEAAATLFNADNTATGTTGNNADWIGTSATYKTENSEWGRAVATGDQALAQSLKGVQGPAGGQGAIGFSDIPLGYDTNDAFDASMYQGGQTSADFAQIPVDLGGVGVIYNLGTATGNNDAFTGADAAVCQARLTAAKLTLNGPELSNIFDGSTTSWSNAAIEATNPRLAIVPSKAAIKAAQKAHKTVPATVQCLANLTNENIATFVRTAGSGTSYIFTQYLHAVDSANSDWPTSVMPSAGNITTEGNSGALAGAVANQSGGIGYVELSYALANTLPTAKVMDGLNKPVALSAGNVKLDATKGMAVIGSSNFGTSSLSKFSLVDEACKNCYPITGFSWAIVQKDQADSQQAIAIAKFLEVLTHTDGVKGGQAQAVANGFVPMPASVQAYAQNAIAGITYNNGTAQVSALSTTN